MKGIVVLRNLADYETFREKQGGGWDRFEIYTLRPRNCLELRLANVPARVLSEHIPAAEAYRIYRRAFKDATHMIDVSSAAQGTGFVQLSRLFKAYYWEFLCESYALDAVLSKWESEKENLHLSYVKRPLRSPIVHTDLVDLYPQFEHMFDMLAKAGRAEAIAAQSGARNNSCPVPAGQSAQDGMYLLRSFFRAVKERIRRTQRIPEGRRAIGWGSSWDALIVIPDMLKVSETTGLRPLLVTEGIDGSTKRTGMVYKEDYDSIERFSIGQHLERKSAPRLTHEESEQVEKAFNGLLEAIDATEIGAKYELSGLFRGLQGELSSSMGFAKQLNDVLSKWQGSALVLTHFNGLGERIIEQLAPRHGIQVYARPHGWLANPEGYEFKSTYYIVPGRLQQQFVREFFGYGERVLVDADQTLLHVTKEWHSKSEEQRQLIVAQKKNFLGIKARYVIMVLATMARNRILSEFDYPTFSTCWSTILDYLRERPELHVVVKAHPEFNYNFWLSALCDQKEVGNVTVLSDRLEEVLGMADLVVDLGYPGTATIVSLLFERPLLLYRGLYKYVREFGDITFDAGRSFMISSCDALLAEWEKLRQQGPAYLADLRGLNASLLKGLMDVENE